MPSTRSANAANATSPAAAKPASPKPTPKAAAAREAARQDAALRTIEEETRRADAETIKRLTSERDAACDARTALERMAEMQSALSAREKDEAVAAAAAAAAAAVQATMDGKLDAANAANQEYADRVRDLEERIRKRDLEDAAARGGGAKKARKSKAQKPTSEAAAAFQADMAADGDAAEAPKRGEKPYAKFSAEATPFDVEASGSSDFFSFLQIASAADFVTAFESDSDWVRQFMELSTGPFRQGPTALDFEASLRTMAEGPYVVDGETYAKKATWIARLGWPELGVLPTQTKVQHAEHATYIANQLKKIVNGINQVVQAYNLYQKEVRKSEGYVPIKMTAHQETLRQGMPMRAMSMVRAHTAGVPLEDYLKSIAPAPAAEADAEADADADAAPAADPAAADVPVVAAADAADAIVA